MVGILGSDHPVGETWRDNIGKSLDEAGCVVVAWSSNSINSRWVQEEADEARERRILIPLLLDRVKPPMGFRDLQAANLAHVNLTTAALAPVLASIEAVLDTTSRTRPGIRPAAPDASANGRRDSTAFGRTVGVPVLVSVAG
ncbi:toll/interleukin-1 receptor domain-containing protein [Nordella sp. HKS 07]|uniref:toll/interleukin-1 receptor domain-containing protein n=1 Tax=Nordella sp. HKS 07 TaxID=2712222 RepID=UPI0013E163C8|nr:toll/interleukin-1 receptor domain-containing protein [Nordella sp. HKS 07]